MEKIKFQDSFFTVVNMNAVINDYHFILKLIKILFKQKSQNGTSPETCNYYNNMHGITSAQIYSPIDICDVI